MRYQSKHQQVSALYYLKRQGQRIGANISFCSLFLLDFFVFCQAREMVVTNHIFDRQLRFRKNALEEVLSLVHIGNFVFDCLHQVKIQIFLRIACLGY